MDKQEKQTLESKRLVFLAIKLFNDNPEGVEFLQLLKNMHLDNPIFPTQDVQKIERHGGALGWAAFREGNIDMLRKIELMANSRDYLLENKDEKK